MAKHGKNINVFLMDGTSSGRIKCTLANWTGVAYRIPRVDIELCKERDDLKQSGIYFLFGETEDTAEKIIYVGQAGARKNGEGILNRLQEHKKNPDKDYWSEAVVFTTSNNSFGPTEISYLEHRFCSMATDAHRYIVKNGNDPTQGNVTEEKECELEEFIEYAKMLMGVLGHRVFEPLIDQSEKDPGSNKMSGVSNVVYCIKSDRHGVNAQAIQTTEGVVVFSGSFISKQLSPSCPGHVKQLREFHRGAIGVNMELTKDILFKTPSGAACFVLGRSANGKTEWKTADGKTFADIENQK